MFVSGQYFRINKFSGFLNGPLVRTWKWVPTFFVRTSAISGLSVPRLTNYHCIYYQWMFCYNLDEIGPVASGERASDEAVGSPLRAAGVATAVL